MRSYLSTMKPEFTAAVADKESLLRLRNTCFTAKGVRLVEISPNGQLVSAVAEKYKYFINVIVERI